MSDLQVVMRGYYGTTFGGKVPVVHWSVRVRRKGMDSHPGFRVGDYEKVSLAPRITSEGVIRKDPETPPDNILGVALDVATHFDSTVITQMVGENKYNQIYGEDHEE